MQIKDAKRLFREHPISDGDDLKMDEFERRNRFVCETIFIIARLIDYQNNVCPSKPSAIKPITGAQQSFCFRLAYKLAQISPSEVEVRERLRVLICKVTGKKLKQMKIFLQDYARESAD